MSLPVILRPEAETDIQAIHDDLEQARAGLGGRFRDASADARGKWIYFKVTATAPRPWRTTAQIS